jgi:hypothetical protein
MGVFADSSVLIAWGKTINPSLSGNFTQEITAS